MTPALAMFAAPQLMQLYGVDIAIVAFYLFVLVLSIGFYLRGPAKTGKDIFLAGREMTAWIAGLIFLSANLGSLERMGRAGILVWFFIGISFICTLTSGGVRSRCLV
jgi:SSS family solute:Na+ symporter